MPPRYVYWTIIVDGQPTAFRSGSLEDIMPTFNRLKEKQPNAELKWFQNGQLWPSRHDAQDFMRARGERGRAKDPRQSDVASGFPVRRSLGEGGSRTEKPERPWNAKPEWKTRSTFSKSDKPRVNRDAPAGERPAWVPKGAGDKPAWKPKGGKPAWKPASAPRSPGASAGRAREGAGKPEWKPASAKASAGQAPGQKPEWKPKGSFRPKEEGHRPSARDEARSSFRPKSFTPKVDDGRTRASRVQSRNDKLEWQPASAKASAAQAPRSRPDGPNSGFAKSDPDAPKRKWVPKADYKKSLGIEAKKDSKWRPGGDHVDPKQKYKDAKKAKWTKFKANIRARSTKPRKQEE